MDDIRTSRALVLVKPETFEMHEFPLPQLSADDAILKVERCGICGSDVEQYDGALASLGYTGAMIPGHEVLGMIASIGERASARWNVKVGDRVAVEPFISCLSCDNCLAGNRTHCNGRTVAGDNVASYGVVGLDVEPSLFGGYAEYMYLHPNSVLHRVPRDMDPDLAVLFNPLGAGIAWGYHEPNLRMGDSVAIMGSGQRGLACVVAAKAAGAGKIIITGTSRSPHKLELASVFGAHHTIVSDTEDVIESVMRLTDGKGVDIAIDTTPYSTQPFLDSLAIVKRGGTVVLPGVKGGNHVADFNSDQLIMKGITLRGALGVPSFAYREAVRLLTEGVAPFERMHSATYSLDEAEKAILHLAGRAPGQSAISVSIAPHL
jgi:threonine dehydrogenase-like Zn-dependent dehydrogenase